MRLTEEALVAMLKEQYQRIATNEPNAIPNFYAWHTGLPQEVRDQISEYTAANDNADAPWRK
jgi:hypothetical protein